MRARAGWMHGWRFSSSAPPRSSGTRTGKLLQLCTSARPEGEKGGRGFDSERLSDKMQRLGSYFNEEKEGKKKKGRFLLILKGNSSNQAKRDRLKKILQYYQPTSYMSLLNDILKRFMSLLR